MFFRHLTLDKKGLETKTLTKFVRIFCRQTHHCAALCPDCASLLDYAKERLAHCPYNPKPKCKNCQTHCYGPGYRDKIKAVMKFSGMYMVKRGRLDWLVKYFLRAG